MVLCVTHPFAPDMDLHHHFIPTVGDIMGDFNVHRLRIGDWVPCAIKSLAVDPFSSKVAIGRENGDIEVIHWIDYRLVWSF